MRSHVNTPLWDAETRKEHTEWLLPFFDSIAAYFSRKHPNYTLYLGDFSRKHPNYTLYLGGFSRKHPNYTPYLGDFSRKHPNYTPYLGGFSRKHPNYTLYLGGFSRKHPNYTPYLGGFGYRKKPIASVFKSGCDDFLLHCIWERERRKRGDRYLLQAVDIVLRHLGTAFAIHTCRNDATGIACSFATREKSPQAHVLQGFAVA